MIKDKTGLDAASFCVGFVVGALLMGLAYLPVMTSKHGHNGHVATGSSTIRYVVNTTNAFKCDGEGIDIDTP